MRNEKDIKYVEVLCTNANVDSYEKRIFLESFEDGSCMCVLKGQEDRYLSEQPYGMYRWSKGKWREIKEPEYIPFDKDELFENLADRWMVNEKNNHIKVKAFSFFDNDSVLIFDPTKSGITCLTSFSLFNEYTFIDGTPVGKIKSDTLTDNQKEIQNYFKDGKTIGQLAFDYDLFYCEDCNKLMKYHETSLSATKVDNNGMDRCTQCDTVFSAGFDEDKLEILLDKNKNILVKKESLIKSVK